MHNSSEGVLALEGAIKVMIFIGLPFLTACLVYLHRRKIADFFLYSVGIAGMREAGVSEETIEKALKYSEPDEKEGR